MTIVNVGVSHRFAPAEMLEKLAVPSAELGDVLTRLHTMPSVDEVAVLSTCNRVEVYAAASGPAIIGLIDAALRASKRARTQTTIGTDGISLARAGLDIAAAHLGGLADRHAVVLGTGSTGKLAARLLREAGVAQLSVAGRNAAQTAEVAPAPRPRRVRRPRWR